MLPSEQPIARGFDRGSARRERMVAALSHMRSGMTEMRLEYPVPVTDFHDTAPIARNAVAAQGAACRPAPYCTVPIGDPKARCKGNASNAGCRQARDERYSTDAPVLARSRTESVPSERRSGRAHRERPTAPQPRLACG